MPEYSEGRKEYEKDEVKTGYYESPHENAEPTSVSKQQFIDLFNVKEGSSIASPPVVHGDTVYFGANDRHLYALDKSGRLRWKFPTGGPVLSSPFISDGRIYFGSSDKYIYCLDTGGNLVWKFLTGDIFGSYPALSGGVLYAASKDGNLYALSADTVKELWRFRTGGMLHSPVVVNNTVYFGSEDRHFYAVSAEGRLLWKFPTGGEIDVVCCITDENGAAVCDEGNRVSAKNINNGTIYFGSWDN